MFLPIYAPSFIESLEFLKGATIQGVAPRSKPEAHLQPVVIESANQHRKMTILIQTERGSLLFDEGLWKFAKTSESRLLLVKTTTHTDLFTDDPPLTKYEIILPD